MQRIEEIKAIKEGLVSQIYSIRQDKTKDYKIKGLMEAWLEYDKEEATCTSEHLSSGF